MRDADAAPQAQIAGWTGLEMFEAGTEHENIEEHPEQPGRLSLHSVYEPSDGTGLERVVAIDVDAQIPKRFSGIADDALASGEFATAESFYSRYLALQPNNSIALINRGSARHRLGQMELAIADFTLAAELGNETGLVFARGAGFM
jgi:tetratricopeptide (TPR) repeat protein